MWCIFVLKLNGKMLVYGVDLTIMLNGELMFPAQTF